MPFTGDRSAAMPSKGTHMGWETVPHVNNDRATRNMTPLPWAARVLKSESQPGMMVMQNWLLYSEAHDRALSHVHVAFQGRGMPMTELHWRASRAGARRTRAPFGGPWASRALWTPTCPAGPQAPLGSSKGIGTAQQQCMQKLCWVVASPAQHWQPLAMSLAP
jgi:hypothetical protein